MKRVLLFAFAIATAVALKADVMNWMVSDDSLSSYNYARLMYADDASKSNPTGPIATTTLEEGVGDEKQIDLASVVGAGYNSKYYYVEVGNYSDNTFTAVKTTNAYSYNDLISAGLVSSGSMNPPSGNSFGDSNVIIAGSSTSYGNVPEPGTATLILLGMAVAGLKRRRV